MNIKKKFWQLYRKLYKLPRSVRIESCSLCQLNCRDCYMRGNYKNKETPIAGNGVLKFKDYKNFINKHPYIEHIELSYSGELFLNKELEKIIYFSHQKGIRLTAYAGVNFNDISDDMLECLVKYRFQGITISIDGASNETYKIYRINGDYNRVINNIKKLNEYKEKYKSKYPILIWQYIVFKHNIHEIQKIPQILKELNFAKVYFKEDWYNEVDFEKHKIPRLIVNKSIETDDYPNETSYSLCESPWLFPQINWDGRLIGCGCAVYRDLGVNVFELGLKNALYSSKAMKMKSILLGEKEPDNNIECTHCPEYKKMKSNNSFINKKKLRFH